MAPDEQLGSDIYTLLEKSSGDVEPLAAAGILVFAALDLELHTRLGMDRQKACQLVIQLAEGLTLRELEMELSQVGPQH